MDAFSGVADLPANRMRDFIMFARQNPSDPNKLPRRRAKREFADLTPETIGCLEEIIEREFGDDADRSSFGWERSEEHTSELQSLMRNSYAVFCLKKKKT